MSKSTTMTELIDNLKYAVQAHNKTQAALTAAQVAVQTAGQIENQTSKDLKAAKEALFSWVLKECGITTS